MKPNVRKKNQKMFLKWGFKSRQESIFWISHRIKLHLCSRAEEVMDTLNDL